MNKIRNNSNLLIAGDKTTNFYQLDAPACKKLLDTTITKAYKKAPPKTACKIIFEEKKISKSIGLDNRIESIAAKDLFVTSKDHKPNFNNNPTCRLTNPAKPEIGIVSKQILQWINSNIAKSTKLNQYNRFSYQVVRQHTRQIHSLIVISFYVVDFYPSISKELLKQALTFASQYDEITENEKHIIIQAKKYLLFNGNSTYCKKTSDSLFDVTMGSYDGAETCELVLPTYYRNLQQSTATTSVCTEMTALQHLIKRLERLRILRNTFVGHSATTA